MQSPLPAPPPDRATRLTRAGLALLVIAAYLVRCRTLADVFLRGRVLLFDPDTSYHLWRIEQTVRSGRPPRFDPFMNAPIGAHVIWPDGFDGVLGWIARLLCGAGAERFDIQAAALLLVPLLGALALVPLFLLGRRVLGRPEALCAALFAALLPSHVMVAYLGLVDHHPCEVLFPPLVLCAWLGALDGDRRWWQGGALGGLALGALIYAVPTALLHAGVIGAAALAAAIAASLRGEHRGARSLLLACAAGFATAALLDLPDALQRGGLAYDRPSALPLCLCAAAAIGSAVLAALAGRGPRPFLGALLGLAVLAVPAALWLLRGAAGYIAGEGLSLVVEAQPLLRDPAGALQEHSLALPVLPLLLVGLAILRRRAAAWALVAWGLCGLGLSLAQSRFGSLLAVPTALALGAGVVELYRRLGRVPPALRLCVPVLAGAVVLWPSLSFLRHLGLRTPASLSLMEAGEWLARSTPAVGPRAPGVAPPPYTVLSMWGDGNPLAYLGERPFLASAFSNGDYEDGRLDAVRLLYGDGDQAELMQRRRVRYVVVTDYPAYVEAAHRRLLGLGPPRAPTLLRHLFDFDGGMLAAAEGVVPARGGLRLRHDSPVPRDETGRVPALKVFEVVAGARIEGPCQGPVRARTQVTSDQGRRFDYVGAAACAGGRFTLRWPYPGTVDLLGVAPGLSRAAVAEADVQEGRAVAVAPGVPH